MYEIKLEPTFRADYKRVMRRYPHLREEFRAVVDELIATGVVPASHNPLLLDNPRANYLGHMDFHLSDGIVDVIVLYMPHKTNPVIRFVRMGSHEELFRGPEL